MKLFYVHAEDGNGESLDSLIEAEDVDQAAALWRYDWDIGEDDDDPKPAYIGEVKQTGVARVIPWQEIIP